MLSALPGSVSDVSRAPTSVRLFTGEGAAASLQEKKGSRRKTAIKVSCPETQCPGWGHSRTRGLKSALALPGDTVPLGGQQRQGTPNGDGSTLTPRVLWEEAGTWARGLC